MLANGFRARQVELLLAVLFVLGSVASCVSQPAPLASNAASTAAECEGDEYSAGLERIGVKRSTDQGATWTFLGHACFHAPSIIPVDPAPLFVPEGVALYFLDLGSLRPETPERVIYRATTSNGTAFSSPVPAFRTADFVTDPFVLRLPDGTYRMYLHSETGIISASSRDGLTFTRDTGVRADGAVPGALALPNGQVRLFVSGGDGISSLISTDGSNFAPEPDVRIPSEGKLIAGAHPIRLRSGGYLLAFDSAARPPRNPPDADAVLATSSDGFKWASGPASVVRANMPGLVELGDGSLLLYYVDFYY